jgi:hypothetical protein
MRALGIASAIAVFCYLLFLSVECSRPQAPSGRPTQAEYQQHSQYQKNFTSNQRRNPAGLDDQNNSDGNKQQADTNSPNGWWSVALSIAAIVISAVTLLVMWRQTNINKRQADLADVQNRIMETQSTILDSTLRETRIAADAATKSSGALIEAERAHVWMVDAHIRWETAGTEFKAFIGYKMKNNGNTVGFLQKVPLAFRVLDELPDVPLPIRPGPFINQRFIPPKDEKGVSWSNIEIQKLFTRDEVNEISSGLKKVFIHGAVHYIDIFGKTHISGFAFEIVHQGDKLWSRPVGPKAYWEYT